MHVTREYGLTPPPSDHPGATETDRRIDLAIDDGAQYTFLDVTITTRRGRQHREEEAVRGTRTHEQRHPTRHRGLPAGKVDRHAAKALNDIAKKYWFPADELFNSISDGVIFGTGHMQLKAESYILRRQSAAKQAA